MNDHWNWSLGFAGASQRMWCKIIYLLSLDLNSCGRLPAGYKYIGWLNGRKTVAATHVCTATALPLLVQSIFMCRWWSVWNASSSTRLSAPTKAISPFERTDTLARVRARRERKECVHSVASLMWRQGASLAHSEWNVVVGCSDKLRTRDARIWHVQVSFSRHIRNESTDDGMQTGKIVYCDEKLFTFYWLMKWVNAITVRSVRRLRTSTQINLNWQRSRANNRRRRKVKMQKSTISILHIDRFGARPRNRIRLAASISDRIDRSKCESIDPLTFCRLATRANWKWCGKHWRRQMHKLCSIFWSNVANDTLTIGKVKIDCFSSARDAILLLEIVNLEIVVSGVDDAYIAF